MSADRAICDGPQPFYAPGAVYDAYARAEHMLRCYGAEYVCQHPELLFGRVPSFDADERHEQMRRQMPYDPSIIQIHPSAACHDTDDDLFVRIISAYQMLDEIYRPNWAPTRARERSLQSNIRAFTDTGDQP